MPNAKKLRYKLIAVVTVLMTATLVAVAAITHSQSLAVIREQSLTLNSRLVEAGVEKLGTSYSQLNNLFQSIYLNENFEAFLRTRGRREGHSTFQDAALMKTVFLSTLSSRSDLYSIIFVDWNGRLFYATRDEAGFYESYLACGLPETYLAQLEGVDGWEHGLRMLPTQLHIPLRSNRSQPPYVYTAARKIVNTEKRFEPVGVMFITVDLSDLERLTNLIRPDEQAITYIAGAGGRVSAAGPARLTSGRGNEAGRSPGGRPDLCDGLCEGGRSGLVCHDPDTGGGLYGRCAFRIDEHRGHGAPCAADCDSDHDGLLSGDQQASGRIGGGYGPLGAPKPEPARRGARRG